MKSKFSLSDLEAGRAAYAERRWREACERLVLANRAHPLAAEDLDRLAWSCGLLGRNDLLFATLEQLYNLQLDAGDLRGAARAAFWLGFRLLFLGEMGRATGWIATSQRVLERVSEDCPERGYLFLPQGLGRLSQKDAAGACEAARRAAEVGERFGDANLTSLSRAIEGQARIALGEREAGLALLDEAILPASTGRLGPVATGIVYCAVIGCCQRVYAIDRAREWSAALAAWCDAQPELVEFNGTCRALRAEILLVQGAWQQAMEEIRAVRPDTSPREAASVCYQRGELLRLRGEFDEAEESYREASKHGREPQPGLALLRLAQGKAETAAAAIAHVVGATRDPLARARYLPAAVEIRLAVGDHDGAAAAARDLAEIASDAQSEIVDAMAAHARGAVDLAGGAPREALEPLRAAFTAWQEVGAPYIAARIRVAIADALQALGDEDGAELERDAARAVFEELGAAPDLARLEAPAADSAASEGGFGLTARELQVLRLIASGRTNQVIARELFLSVKTVDRHVSNIFTKLDVPTRAAATAFAYQHKMI